MSLPNVHFACAAHQRILPNESTYYIHVNVWYILKSLIFISDKSVVQLMLVAHVALSTKVIVIALAAFPPHSSHIILTTITGDCIVFQT